LHHRPDVSRKTDARWQDEVPASPMTRCYVPQPAAQLFTTTPQTLTDTPQGMVVQSGSAQAAHVPWLLHALPALQVPQLRVTPHPLETVPQAFVPQACAALMGEQQAFAWHTLPAEQVLGQVTVPPHPSETEPHPIPLHAALPIGMQHALAWQTWLAPHLFGHATVPPHPLDTGPQATLPQASAADTGLQHAWSAPQVSPPQVPQVTDAPHASRTVPQVAPSDEQSASSFNAVWQAPATHAAPVGHDPHCSVPPQPSLRTPQTAPSALHVVLLHVPQVWATASQTWGPAHVPHERGWPQPSSALPEQWPHPGRQALLTWLRERGASSAEKT